MIDENSRYIKSLLDKGLREDGRKLEEYRKISIEYGVSAKSAEGSARVKIGETEVVAGVKFDIGTPFPDRPDEGTIIVNAELLPLSSPEFESGPPGVESIELSRVVDRGIRESKAIDFKKLCIKAGEKIWMVFIDIYPINDAGNLFDAAALAAIAALKDAKFPKYDEETETVLYKERTNKPLEIQKTPMACTVIKIGNHYIVDPTHREQAAAEARLTTVALEDDTMCAMQKGGEGSLTQEDILNMVQISLNKAKELRRLVK